MRKYNNYSQLITGSLLEKLRSALDAARNYPAEEGTSI
jgi:hypothetical protein